MILFLQLVLAHMIGDFFLQWDKWIKDKETKKARSIYLYLHALIHFLLILLLVGNGSFWLAASFIAISHLLIDLVKISFQKPSTRRSWFFIDQAAHFLMLFIVWCWWNSYIPDFTILQNKKLLVLLTATISLLYPASFFIKAVIAKWEPDFSQRTTAASLQEAGRLIGFLERLLILLFVLLGKWEGVGFLLAAKSIFRFGDLKDSKDRKLTEYVLIGTLLSFGIALTIGIIASYLT